MRMAHARTAIALVATVTAGISVVGFFRAGNGVHPATTGPASIRDAVAVARRLGLVVGSSAVDGSLDNAAVFSTFPLTTDACASLPVGRPYDPRWTRTVIALNAWRHRLDASPAGDPHMAIWGEVYLYGDPVLIARLMDAP